MEQKVEKEASEIRDNLERVRRGEPAPEKKKPIREAGQRRVLLEEQNDPSKQSQNNDKIGGVNSGINNYNDNNNAQFNNRNNWANQFQNNNKGTTNQIPYSYSNFQVPYQNPVPTTNHVPSHLTELSL